MTAGSLEKIQVGIVGLGRIADLHAPGYAGSRHARIYAVCDTDADLALKRKKEWKAARHFTSFEEMLGDPAVDAVEILTPQKLHEPMAIAAARAGKHIAIQKPMTTDLASADRMLRSAGGSSAVFRVTDNYLFYPPIVLAKKLIDDGAIGTPSNMRIKFTGGFGGWDIPASSWEWRMQERAEGRGIQTFDHGHHLYATAWRLMGEIERVTAWIDYADGVLDCPAVIMFKNANRASYGVIEYAQAKDLRIPSKYYANDEWIEITGSGGIIMVHRCTGNIHAGPAVSLFNRKKWTRYNVASDWREGFIGATGNFIDAIMGKTEPLLSGAQGRALLRFALAVQRSSRRRREVYLDEMDSPWPWILSKTRALRDRSSSGDGLLSRRSGGAAYARQAKQLTEGLPARFNAAAAPGWRCVAGLHILADAGVEESKYCAAIDEKGISLKEGPWPESAAFVLSAPAGTWAAILLGKKKIETAFVQGKLKIRGKAEEALKLKASLRL
ncbi:MAG TPA: Gfo/Idh/MocA family oxidoreductase [Spirochaetota bacterium]|nr:Gfo/Idh/MocA family oxidoreductase [Spirochaetota bacterium]HPV39540.1 Gfo/Idh/MocA family oxidoreductase [Spirochaetota bacterium]